MVNFPLSIQSFEKLRQDGCVYVDKTDYIYSLVTHGCTYFLARPRRFGKSLLCNTLRAFFEGKKELFEGLKIYDLEKNWIKYPIIYLDFVSGDYSVGSLTLINKFRVPIIEYEKEYGIEFDESLIQDKIEQINEETKHDTIQKESMFFRFVWNTI